MLILIKSVIIFPFCRFYSCALLMMRL